jgi:hypothetical protein
MNYQIECWRGQWAISLCGRIIIEPIETYLDAVEVRDVLNSKVMPRDPLMAGELHVKEVEEEDDSRIIDAYEARALIRDYNEAKGRV